MDKTTHQNQHPHHLAGSSCVVGAKSLRPERLCGSLPVGPRGDRVDPGDALDISPSLLVPTMLTKRELDYLHYLASDQAGGGRIVELGCFLGGSTRPLVVGQSHRGEYNARVIVYDRFVASLEQSRENRAFLATYGLVPGQEYLNDYKMHHAAYLQHLTIRKLEIPETCHASAGVEMYPEQEPIALLFVDAAKSWGVHEVIAKVFYHHMYEDAVLVHQDFGDFRTPWLLIHMYELREAFAPLDMIRETPTVSFRCVRSSPSNSVISRTPSGVDASEHSECWSRLTEYWSEVLGDDATGWVSGHRAVHAIHARHPKSAVCFAEQYDRWAATASSHGYYVSPDWGHWLQLLPGYLSKMDASEELLERAEMLALSHRVLDGIATSGTVFQSWRPDAFRAQRWECVERQLKREKVSNVILYGGGRHTRWLLSTGWPSTDISIVCIVDDNPITRHLGGIPVLRPQGLGSYLADKAISSCVVLPSSDAYESHLLDRINGVPSLAKMPAWRVYTDQTYISDRVEVPTSQVQDNQTLGMSRQFDESSVEMAPLHRSELGLDSARSWLSVLSEHAVWPHWTQGHINSREAAFLWDILERAAQHEMSSLAAVEIGTASGLSSALIGLGLEEVTRGNWCLDTYDIMETCYFDRTRSAGSAIQAIVPSLVDRIRVHHNSNARDAARQHAPESVAFVFIDADHRHPSPAIDLLSLLYVLSPGAWVVLHDLELDRLSRGTDASGDSQSGPSELFHAWPHDKVRDTGSTLSPSNIGALQMPQHPTSVRRWLVDFIESATVSHQL